MYELSSSSCSQLAGVDRQLFLSMNDLKTVGPKEICLARNQSEEEYKISSFLHTFQLCMSCLACRQLFLSGQGRSDEDLSGLAVWTGANRLFLTIAFHRLTCPKEKTVRLVTFRFEVIVPVESHLRMEYNHSINQLKKWIASSCG